MAKDKKLLRVIHSKSSLTLGALLLLGIAGLLFALQTPTSSAATGSLQIAAYDSNTGLHLTTTNITNPGEGACVPVNQPSGREIVWTGINNTNRIVTAWSTSTCRSPGTYVRITPGIPIYLTSVKPRAIYIGAYQ